MKLLENRIIQFELPAELACPLPTEERKMERDEVRLLVTTNHGEAHHTTFKNLPDWLEKGDVLVVNTSATIPAALPISLRDGKSGRLHLSTRLNEHKWLVEIREVITNKTKRWHEGKPGMTFQLPSGAHVTLEQKFYKNDKWLDLWIAEFNIPHPMHTYLTLYGSPIQYDKLERKYPLSYYQTFFSFQNGSSEMPSAGRGFTKNLVEKLLNKGVVFAPVLLHTGVSSLEENEAPYPEYMEIDAITAAIINNAKTSGHRIIAVGTTSVRAIETAANEDGEVMPFHGRTELFIDEDYNIKVINGLLTGFHEPHASHLNMLQAIAGYSHIDMAYTEAIKSGYYWHQFGDLHLILS